MASSASKDETPADQSRENSKKDWEILENEEGVYKYNFYIYDDLIKKSFFIISFAMFFLIVLLIQFHTKKINHFNYYFYNVCHGPGLMPTEDVLEIGHKIGVVQKKIESFQKTASSDFSWGEENSEKLSAYEIELNTSLELCNTQLKLRESCYMDQLNDFSDDQNVVFTNFIIPYISFFIAVVIFFAFCLQRLFKFSVDDDFVFWSKDTLKFMVIYVVLMAMFLISLCLYYYPKDPISNEDVPLLCGNQNVTTTLKFVTEDCYHYSFECYVFPRNFEFAVDVPYMFIFFSVIAIFCFAFGFKYQTYYYE